MSFRRKVALSMAGGVVLLFAILALAPLLLRDRIEARVKQAIASNIEARVEWRELDLSLLRTFPNLSLRLHDLSVAGAGSFARDTLIAIPRFQLVLDLGSVLRNVRGKGPLVVRTVELREPRARLLVLENGAANWDIVPERERTGEDARGFDVSLRRFEIADGAVTLENRQTGSSGSIAGLHHTLSGDFSKQRFTLETETSADTTSVRFAGVSYLSQVQVKIAAMLDADMTTRTFTLRDNSIRVNDLLLKAAGTIVAGKDNVGLDLAFEAPRTEFREILSLVPAVYTQNFKTLKTSGSMSLHGHVRGEWGERAFPAFAVNATVQDGAFRYPDLPLPARDISMRLALANPGGSIDNTVLNVERFHIVLGSDAVDGSLVMRTPVTDPDLGLSVKGRVDLANVPRTLKLKDVEQLSGTVIADATMRTRRSDVTHKRYDRVSASGAVRISRMTLNAAGLRVPLRIDEAVLRLTPRHAELSSFRGSVGSSDITMTGSLENLVGFVMQQEDLRGDATVASRHFDLNEWRSDDEVKAIVVPGRIDLTLRAAADEVVYGTLKLRNARGGLSIKTRRATLEDFSMETLGGRMAVTGSYETLDTARPLFNLAVDLEQVDVAEAFAGIRTVQAFAPVARYAQGQVSAQVKLNGALGSDMMPILQNLSGIGSLLTSGLVLRSFPPFEKLAQELKLQQLRDPGFKDLKSSFSIDNGRLSVKPFDVHAGPVTMNVAGWNGIDQSLDYTVALTVPRSIMGAEANRAVATIVNRSGRTGFNLAAAENITLAARVTGTVTNPTLTTSFRDAAAGAAQNVAQSLEQEAERRRQIAEARVDSAAEAARQRAIAEAEDRAAEIRTEAAALAAKLRAEGHQRADSLETRASGLARIATKAAADRLRKETDAKADAMVREADTRAQALVDEARRRTH